MPEEPVAADHQESPEPSPESPQPSPQPSPQTSPVQPVTASESPEPKPQSFSQRVKSSIDGLVGYARLMEGAETRHSEAREEADAATLALSNASSDLSHRRSSFVAGCNDAIGVITEMRDAA